MQKPLTISIDGVDYPFHLNGIQKVQNSALKILRGITYPLVDNIDVKVVLDLGANIGAASVFFALSYRDASIYAFEPATINYKLLEKNSSYFANIHVFQKGIHEINGKGKLFVNSHNPERNSLVGNWAQSNTFEEIELMRLDKFLFENSIKKIDILKIDTEGCELQILQTILNFIPEIEVIYLEYHNKAQKNDILTIINKTHDLISDNLTGVANLKLCNYDLEKYTNYKDIVVGETTVLRANKTIEKKDIQKLKNAGIEEIKVWSNEMGEIIATKKNK